MFKFRDDWCLYHSLACRVYQGNSRERSRDFALSESSFSKRRFSPSTSLVFALHSLSCCFTDVIYSRQRIILKVPSSCSSVCNSRFSSINFWFWLFSVSLTWIASVNYHVKISPGNNRHTSFLVVSNISFKWLTSTAERSDWSLSSCNSRLSSINFWFWLSSVSLTWMASANYHVKMSLGYNRHTSFLVVSNIFFDWFPSTAASTVSRLMEFCNSRFSSINFWFWLSSVSLTLMASVTYQVTISLWNNRHTSRVSWLMEFCNWPFSSIDFWIWLSSVSLTWMASVNYHVKISLGSNRDTSRVSRLMEFSNPRVSSINFWFWLFSVFLTWMASINYHVKISLGSNRDTSFPIVSNIFCNRLPSTAGRSDWSVSCCILTWVASWTTCRLRYGKSRGICVFGRSRSFARFVNFAPEWCRKERIPTTNASDSSPSTSAASPIVGCDEGTIISWEGEVVWLLWGRFSLVLMCNFLFLSFSVLRKFILVSYNSHRAAQSCFAIPTYANSLLIYAIRVYRFPGQTSSTAFDTPAERGSLELGGTESMLCFL